MKSKLLHDNGEKTFALIFETGDAVVKGLETFARDHHLTAARFSAIGAFEEVTLAYFRLESQDYKPIPLREQVEVLSLLGDITLDEEDTPKVHAHAIVGLSDGATRGGHLMEAIVRPTLEVMLIESPDYLMRKFDPGVGLALIDPQAHH